ncbi:MAG: hypothetical protein ACI90A_000899 [Shewanella sp.]|jgi:hypothetical protein
MHKKNNKDAVINMVLSSGIFQQEMRNVFERRKYKGSLCIRYNRRLMSERRGIKSVDTYI